MEEIKKAIITTQDEIMNEMVEDINVLMQFAKQAGIPTDKISKYCLESFDYSFLMTNLLLSFGKNNDEKCEFDMEDVILTFDKKRQLVTIVRKIENQSNFKRISDGPMTSCIQYRRRVEQIVTEFEVNHDSLDVTAAAIIQNIREDTMGGGNWTIVDFNSIHDFENEEKISWSHAIPCFHKESYEVPEGYKLIDGLGVITTAPKTIKKTL